MAGGNGDGGTGLAMGWAEWARHDGVALAELVRTRQVSAQQVAAQAAAAVARLNPKLEAVIELFDDVRANPDADGPDRSGKLYGVPIFLKDLGSGLKGRTQDSGSAFTKGTRIAATDPTVENYLRAGLVPLGRSTTPEFGMTFDTTTDYRGEVKVTRSPWNLARTPGGSSGGSAAAVAAGHCAVFDVFRRRRFHPHPGVVLRPGRAEGVARSRAAAAGAQRIRHPHQHRRRGVPQRARYRGGV